MLSNNSFLIFMILKFLFFPVLTIINIKSNLVIFNIIIHYSSFKHLIILIIHSLLIDKDVSFINYYM